MIALPKGSAKMTKEKLTEDAKVIALEIVKKICRVADFALYIGIRIFLCWFIVMIMIHFTRKEFF